MLALVYGIVNAGSEGWGAPAALGPIGLGVALLAAFAVIEGRIALAPLVPLRIFASRPLRVANIVVLLFSAALFPMWYLTSLYLQEVLHMRPLGAGLAFLPMALTIMACATLAGSLVARFGARLVLGVGLTLMAIGMALFFALVTVDGSYGSSVLLPGLLVSVGVGLSVVPSTIVATAGAKPSEAGLASGLVNTSRQMGGALGLAILTSFGAQYASHLINADYQAPLLALTNGFRLGYLLGAVFVGLAAIVAFTLIPKLPRRAPAAESTPSVSPQATDAASTADSPAAAAAAASPAPASVEDGGASPAPPPPVPVPASANGSARPAPASAPDVAPTNAPAPTAKPREGSSAHDPLARPVAAVVFSVAGGGRWPLASGTMTTRVAGDKRAGRVL
jgi:hypothetical protein